MPYARLRNPTKFMEFWASRLEHSGQPVSTDAQLARGGRLVALAPIQTCAGISQAGLLQAETWLQDNASDGGLARRHPRLIFVEPQVLNAKGPMTQNHRPLNRVLELSYVAGPGVSGNRGHGLGRERQRRTVVPPRKGAQKVFG